MPTYEYVCKSCGDTIEKVQSFSDKPLRRHDKCGGDLQKVFHARGIVFKGPGFYSTDARAPQSTSKKSEGSKTKETSKSKDGSGSSSKEPSKSKDGSGSSSKEPSTPSVPSPTASASSDQ